jgi:restriction system protein
VLSRVCEHSTKHSPDHMWPGTEIGYRLAWARTYLKGMGLAENSQRGVWSLADAGLNVEPEQIQPMRQKYIAATRSRMAGGLR